MWTSPVALWWVADHDVNETKLKYRAAPTATSSRRNGQQLDKVCQNWRNIPWFLDWVWTSILGLTIPKWAEICQWSKRSNISKAHAPYWGYQQDHSCCSSEENQEDSQGLTQAGSCWATHLQASQRTQQIACHTRATHQMESVCCAELSAAHHQGESYWSLWGTARLLRANKFFNLSCRIRVRGLDGQPIHRAFEIAQREPQHSSHVISEEDKMIFAYISTLHMLWHLHMQSRLSCA